MNTSALEDTGGSALALQNSSASAVLSTLGPVTGYAAAFFILFLILRKLSPQVYSPRTLQGALRPEERTTPLPGGFFKAFQTFFRISDHHVLNSQTLDGYMFLRLLRVSVISCVVGCLITWPILLPVNATGPGGQTQLNTLSIGNAVNPTDPSSYNRYWAHVFCAYIFFGFIIHMITRETVYFINIRQAYLVSPVYANRVSSRTVMFSSVPDEYLKEDILQELLGEDIVSNIWIPRHVAKLQGFVDERDGVAMKLENAEIKLIKDANTARRKALKKERVAEGEEFSSLRNEPKFRQDSTSTTTAGRWLDHKRRPTHRLTFLIGEKVDTIDWCKKELLRLIPETEALQHDHRAGNGRPYNAAFVEFKSLRDAQSAFQSVTHHQAARMSPRFTGVHPEEIIWSNLRIKWWERTIRQFLVVAFVVGLIVFWSIPVGAISLISNVENLKTIRWLRWLGFVDNLPKSLSGLITGLLPSILLSVVMILLPPILRLAHQLGGDPTYSEVEYSLQSSYFWFQLIQVFLVTTLSGGFLKTITKVLGNLPQIFEVLASSLPEASNFYLSYIILQGLGVVANTLLSVVNLLLYYGLGSVMDKSPRKKYDRFRGLVNPGLGQLYPVHTVLFIIAIAYSCIAPLVLGFAAIGLFFFYTAYRYEFLFVYHVPYDTKGLMYARALQQLFVGLYLAELCLIGLFATQVANSLMAIGPLVMIVLLLVGTALYHYALNRAFAPLLRYLPKTLETEEQRLLAMEMTQGGAEEYEYRGAGRTVMHHADPASEPINKPATDLADLNADTHWLRKWLRPDKYDDYYTLRKQVPRNFGITQYDEALEQQAYFHPAVNALPPTLWVPKDEAGVSADECRHVSMVIPMSDQGGAVLTDRGKIVWVPTDDEKVPIAKEKVYW